MADSSLSAGAAARRLGIAVTTLRSWHERYGLGPSEHRPPQHRRYTIEDLDRLETMRRLTSQGISAAEAARVALSSPTGGSAPAANAPVIDAASTRAAVQGLTRTASRLDMTTMSTIVTDFITRHGVIATWDHLLRPVLTTVGERHRTNHQAIEVEHLLTRTISDVFAGIPQPAATTVPALLACADEEQHTLPLEALTAALATVGIGARLLGARVPPAALAAAIRRTGPAVVVVWAQMPAAADAAQLASVLAARPRPRAILAAGPGWYGSALPAGIQQPNDLAEAVEQTVAAIGAAA